MLLYVSRHCRHHCRRARVCLHKLLDFWVLHCGRVHLNVRLVVLVHKRLDGLTVKYVHVLGHRVTRLHVFAVLKRDQLFRFLDTQHLKHLTMQVGQVVKLRCALSQLNDRLILDDLLSHRSSVGVAYGDYFYSVVVCLLCALIAHYRLILVAR